MTAEARITRIAPLFSCANRGMQALLGAFIDAGRSWGCRIIANHLHGDLELLGRAEIIADGLLMFVGDPPRQQYFKEFGLPLVGLSSAHPHPVVPSVWPDNRELGEIAARHLQELGLDHFAFAAFDGGQHFIRERLAGFAGSLRGGREVIDLRVSKEAWKADRRILVDPLRELPPRCGILAVDDLHALVVLNELRAAGKAVPDDVLLVGINDDDSLVPFVDPTITSVRLPYEELGRRAAELMGIQLQGGEPPTHPVVVGGAELVARDSTRPAASADQDLARAQALIRERARHQPLTAEDVARDVGLSRKTLDRRFQAGLGHTVADEITDVRRERLRSLLADTDWPMKRVAAELGFTDADQLTHWCRRRTGRNPTALRRQVRERGPHRGAMRAGG